MIICITVEPCLTDTLDTCDTMDSSKSPNIYISMDFYTLKCGHLIIKESIAWHVTVRLRGVPLYVHVQYTNAERRLLSHWLLEVKY